MILNFCLCKMGHIDQSWLFTCPVFPLGHTSSMFHVVDSLELGIKPWVPDWMEMSQAISRETLCGCGPHERKQRVSGMSSNHSITSVPTVVLVPASLTTLHFCLLFHLHNYLLCSDLWPLVFCVFTSTFQLFLSIAPFLPLPYTQCIVICVHTPGNP
jgi:hypothetical protein